MGRTWRSFSEEREESILRSPTTQYATRRLLRGADARRNEGSSWTMPGSVLVSQVPLARNKPKQKDTRRAPAKAGALRFVR
jgi:hypothetical protein